MHCTGQVSKSKGWLETPEAEATTRVCPGMAGVAVAWLVGTLTLLSVTMGVMAETPKLVWLQTKAPTWSVMLLPWLSYAVACNVMSWFGERQELVGLRGSWQASGSAICAGQAGGGELTGGTTLTWMLAM